MQRLERQAEELAALRDVGRALAGSLELDDVLQIILRAVTETLGFDMGAIALVDPNSGLIRGVLGINQDEAVTAAIRCSLDSADIRAHVIRSGKVEVVDGWDPRLDRETFEKYGHHNHATIFGPITVHGERIGVLSASRQRASHSPITPHEYGLFTVFLDHAGIALQNARILESERKKSRRLSAVNEVARRMSSLMTSQELLPFVVELLRETFQCYSVSIFLRPAAPDSESVDTEASSDATSIVLAAAAGGDPGPMPAGTRLRLGQDGIVGWVAAVGEALLANDVCREPRFLAYPGLPDTAAEVAMPIRWGERVVGVLDVQSRQRNDFDAFDVTTLQTLADQIGIALENARLYTEAAERAATLAQANQRLAELDRMKSHFVSMVSHELRTPLGLIKGYVGTLQRSDLQLDSESRQEFLTVIEEEADNLADLVGNLLDASRLEAGTLALELHPTRLLPIVRKAVHDARERAPDYQFHLRAPAELPLIAADSRRLEQVLRNLLDNAVKYSPAGSSITVSSDAVDGGVAIAVRDEGRGIAPEHLDRIFDTFYRVDQTDNRRGGGSGLGLAIAKGIIDGHGGRIRVESVPNVGSTFRLWLPA
jgi:K+-sensing histidine kinase KdpD